MKHWNSTHLLEDTPKIVEELMPNKCEYCSFRFKMGTDKKKMVKHGGKCSRNPKVEGIRKSNSITKDKSIEIGGATNKKVGEKIDRFGVAKVEHDHHDKNCREVGNNNGKDIFEKILNKIGEGQKEENKRLWRYEMFQEYEAKHWEDVIWWRGRLIKPSRKQRKWWLATMEKMSKDVVESPIE